MKRIMLVVKRSALVVLCLVLILGCATEEGRVLNQSSIALYNNPDAAGR